ncbi:hypothetical protein LCGC14_1601690 [marine sediment metagenome]|uniref:Uncharacterized protein n=1 Tax=marine sediment metagenome TaxID=412755 RepID=A0A0F9IXI0_9ZZZZ
MGITCGVRMKIRISYFVQEAAFALALLVPPSAVLAGVGLSEEVLYCTGYAWGVGIVAALWHRGTVAE